MSTNHQAPNVATQAAVLPGEYWPGEGGIYLGIIRDGDKHYHLFMATAAFEGPWGEYGNDIEGEFSRVDGAHNMQLILAAEPDNALCNAIKNHEADGHNDFHLPAEFENNLICINAREHVESVWHWSSTQDDARRAWFQVFESGFQFIFSKYHQRAARAVRRLLIQ
jgi:hypothetical protein